MGTLLLALLIATYQEPPKPVEPVPAPMPPPAPTIRFPAVKESEPPEPVAPPTVDPNAIPKLLSDALYVIDSDTKLIVLVSPLGFATVEEAEGPVTIRSKFIDSPNNKPETRRYGGKAVYIISPVKTGRIEILVVPIAEPTIEKVVRKTIDVYSGQAPQPPPKPDPIDPIPDPKPIPDEPVDPVDPDVDPEAAKKFRVLFLYETAPDVVPSRGQVNVVNSLKIRQWLDEAAGKGSWRVWDKDINPTKDTKEWQDMMKAAKSMSGLTLPAMIIFKGKTGKAYPIPADASEAATLEFLKKEKGTK